MPAKKSVAPPPSAAETPTPKKTRGLNFQLQVGLISLPIKLYTGARAEKVSFRQLHKECLAGLKQPSMRCPACDVEAKGEDVVKGYEFRKDEYIVVSDEELEAQKPDNTHTIEVESFAEEAEVDPVYLETSHYVAPGATGARAYILICELLRRTHKVALGKVTMNSREHVVMIRPHGRGLALHTLFYEGELNAIQFPVEQVTIPAAEIKLGTQLIDSMTQPFRPQSYRDAYADNIRGLISSKLAGKPVVAVAKKPVAPQQDLMSALNASINAAKGRKKVA